jgi:hypothetical protein
MGFSKDTLTALSSAALEVVPGRDGTRITLRFCGNADTEVHEALGNYLHHVHAYAVQTGATEVAVNLDELYFMTSSCFKCFVTWLVEIEKLDLAARYRVRFQPNPNLHWQGRSLEALRSLARGVVRIQAAS